MNFASEALDAARTKMLAATAGTLTVADVVAELVDEPTGQVAEFTVSVNTSATRGRALDYDDFLELRRRARDIAVDELRSSEVRLVYVIDDPADEDDATDPLADDVRDASDKSGGAL